MRSFRLNIQEPDYQDAGFPSPFSASDLPASFLKFLEGLTEENSSHSTCSDTPLSFSELGDQFGSITLDNIADYSKTRAGSKNVQQLIARSRPEQIQKFVDAIGPEVGQLMTDPYGNYMCQSLFQSSTSTQRLFLLSQMQSSLQHISMDPKGTHALQTLISMASLQEEEEIYQKHFNTNAAALAVHPNASHSLQKLLVTLKDTNFIIDQLLGSICMLSTNKLGLCVIKKCISNDSVCQELLQNFVTVVQDPYGNYAIQYMIEFHNRKYNDLILDAVRGNEVQLCIQKYASNVMEKFMRVEQLRDAFVPQITVPDKLPLILNCSYGCYVLKTASQFGNRDLKKMIKDRVLVVYPLLHMKKLRSRWDDILNYCEFQY